MYQVSYVFTLSLSTAIVRVESQVCLMKWLYNAYFTRNKNIHLRVVTRLIYTNYLLWFCYFPVVLSFLQILKKDTLEEDNTRILWWWSLSVILGNPVAIPYVNKACHVWKCFNIQVVLSAFFRSSFYYHSTLSWCWSPWSQRPEELLQ